MADKKTKDKDSTIFPFTGNTTPQRAVHITGTSGGWVSNTLLSHTAQFKSNYAGMVLDRSSGLYAKRVAFTVPETFDGKKVWKDLLPPVQNQGGCGACWAFASTTSLSARLAIATNGGVKHWLSTAEMVICNMGSENEIRLAKDTVSWGLPYDFNTDMEKDVTRAEEREAMENVGCNGETLIGAWQYLYRFGSPEIGCVTYDNPRDDNTDLFNYKKDISTLPVCAEVTGDTYDRCPIDGSFSKCHIASCFYMVPGVPKSGDGTNDMNMRPQLKTGTDKKQALTSTDGDHEVKESVEDKAEDKAEAEMSKVAKQAAELRKAITEKYAERNKTINGDEYNIRRDIYHWGPASTGFIVHEDFMNWDGVGIYRWDGKSAEKGGHAVVITGWGDEDGNRYWQCMNSWGTEWGDGGFFRIARGVNECGIEDNVVVGLPSLHGYRLFLEWPILFREDDMWLRTSWGIDFWTGYKETTFEALTLGHAKAEEVDVSKPLYPPEHWPDLSTFVAGEYQKTVYPISLKKSAKYALAADYQYTREDMILAALVGGAAACILVSFLCYMSKPRRK